jgi:hypothetical protein
VKEPGANASSVELELGDDPRYGRGVNEVRIARFTELSLMRAITEIVRALDELGVRRRMIRLDAMDEIRRLQHGDGKLTPVFT